MILKIEQHINSRHLKQHVCAALSKKWGGLIDDVASAAVASAAVADGHLQFHRMRGLKNSANVAANADAKWSDLDALPRGYMRLIIAF